MKILEIVHHYYPARCGSGYRHKIMAERSASEGHDVTVWTTDAFDIERLWSNQARHAEPGSEKINGVNVRRFKPLALPDHFRTMERLRSFMPTQEFRCMTTPCFVPGMWFESIKRKEWDIVHAGLLPYGFCLYSGLKAARTSDCPFVVTPCHHSGEDADKGIRYHHADPAQLAVLQQADHIFVHSEKEAESLLELNPQLDKEKMSLFGMGIEPAKLCGGDGEKFRREYDLGSRQIIFYIGTKTHDKGVNHVVEAMEYLWRHGEQARLVLLGMENQDFIEWNKGWSDFVRNRVINITNASDETKKDLLDAGDIFVMPSRNDSFGVSYLEAWYYKNPVIGAFAGGVPELIKDGYDGFLAPFANVMFIAETIQKLLKDKEMQRKMGERGHRKVLEKYTFDIAYNKVREVYEKLTDGVN